MEKKCVEIKKLYKNYGKDSTEIRALQNINLTILKQEFVAIVGRSGSGKSTLLNIIGGLDVPTSGDVIIDRQNVFLLNDRKRTIFRRDHIGYVFQSLNLISEMTVYENICLPTYIAHREPDTISVQMIMDKLGISSKKDRYPAEISKGEQQRVAVARALVGKPSILLADEPTGNLDKKNGDDLIELLLFSNRYFKQTILLVTHDLEMARMAQRIVVLEDGKLQSDQRKIEI